jgi:FkbH-like protein
MNYKPDNLLITHKILTELLNSNSPKFWDALRDFSWGSADISELISANTLRKRALQRPNLYPPHKKKPLKLALIGAYTLFPIQEIVAHLLELECYNVELFIGEYDNYHNEILDFNSELNKFCPEFLFFFPSAERCRYMGELLDSIEQVEEQAQKEADEILHLCETIHKKHDTNIILANFPLPQHYDLGALKAKCPTSLWNYRKFVNLRMGLDAPFFINICDIEFLSARIGLKNSWDEKSWLETKQPFHAKLMPYIAKEISLLIIKSYVPHKKVLVVDADDTLWGGVIGDDGISGIEIGDTSARGQAFKKFQNYILDLKSRGILIALCSKNSLEIVQDAFLNHPDMVLKIDDFSSFKANWNPKPENIFEIAEELNLGLDSFVFVDDNPAEIELVRQNCSEVTSICLRNDPSLFIELIDHRRLFEPISLTQEDFKRSNQYQIEKKRTSLRKNATSIEDYLVSLEMVGTISEFTEVDTSRIFQLINKSNQFNLTTIRRNESEVRKIITDKSRWGFSCRLKDKFGDHGLISLVILKIDNMNVEIDTWLMSCRVLQRQVEKEVMNEIVRVAKLFKIKEIVGYYLPTKKNVLVKDLLDQMGMTLVKRSSREAKYKLTTSHFIPFKSKIHIIRK